MTRQPKKRPVRPDPPDAYTRFQKFTLALVKVPREEIERKRAEYEREREQQAQRT